MISSNKVGIGALYQFHPFILMNHYTVRKDLPIVSRVLIILLILPNFGLLLFSKSLGICLSKNLPNHFKIVLNFGTKFVYLLMVNMAFASFDQTLVKMSNQLVKT